MGISEGDATTVKAYRLRNPAPRDRNPARLSYLPQATDPALVSLLAFWADAGVDVVALDQPFDRVEAGAQRSKPTRPPTSRPTSAKLAPVHGSSVARDHPGDVSVAAVQAAQAAASLAELAEVAARFDFGGLARGKPVFGRGSDSPDVVVLGDEPCADDAETPFSGRAGALLDRMMSAAGLGGRVWVSNVSFWPSGGDRTLATRRQAACRPFLDRAIDLGQPQALLLLGGEAAAWAGLPDGILKARGRWTDWKGPFVAAPALATFHPGFLLDHAEAKKRAWGDLLSLTGRIAGL